MKASEAIERMRDCIRLRHFALSTERCYVDWARRYCACSEKRTNLLATLIRRFDSAPHLHSDGGWSAAKVQHLAAGFALALALSGCAVVGSWPKVQLAYRHVLTESEGWGVAREWSAGSPGRGVVTAGNCCGSMLPHIRGGQLLLLLPIDATPLAPGSVAIFRDPRGGPAATTVHAVAEDNGRAVLFYGTNNRRSDGWVPRERVLWRVVGVVTWPGVGNVRDLAAASASAGALRRDRRE